MDLPLIFAMVAAFGIAVYVLADGFDLGIGILFLIAPRDQDRDLMMESVAPLWDGNETWLVLGGTLLLAAFPAAYYVLLPALYVPVIVMLLSLIMRGVAFEFRFRAGHLRRVWDFVFAAGSFFAAVSQGFILGGFVQGVRMQDGAFSGGPLDFFSVLGLLCAAGLAAGYALLGAGWLIWKTDGSTQVFGREVGRAALILTMVMMVLVSIWTALTEPDVTIRWFAWPQILPQALLPIAAAGVASLLWIRIWGTREVLPFLLGMGLFLLGFAGLAVSLWPYVVPRHLTIWDGVADLKTLHIIGYGLIVILPIIVAYLGHAYWVFRGKTPADRSGLGASVVPSVEAKLTSSLATDLHLS